MPSPMDNMPFANVPQSQPSQDGMMEILQMAQQNPQMFEDNVRRTNPQAYQMACQIRNSANPREAILRLAQQRGVNPNVLKMFGII